MVKLLTPPPQHERFNTYSHLFAFFGALLGCIYLLSGSLYEANLKKLILFSIYTLSEICLFAISSVYHAQSSGPHGKLLMRLDHLGIYMKIAGNYTPYVVLTLPFFEGSLIFAVVWGLAILGSLYEFYNKSDSRKWSYVIYVLMSSSIILGAKPFVNSLPSTALVIIALGFISYAIGFYFYLTDHRWKYGHELWHILVIGGSVFHFLPLAIYTVSFPIAGHEQQLQEFFAQIKL